MYTVRVLAVMALLSATTVRAQTATTAGVVSTPFPTTQSIAIEWAITGDSNVNGVVTVRYRPMGAGTWKTGAPLVRVPAGSNTTGTFGSGGAWANKHAGSLFDLTPGTSWEIELTLTDPDGGGQTKTVSVATRAVPRAAANAPVKNVTPTNFTAMLDAAVPGDVLLLAAGNYPPFTMEKSGTPEAPIVIRGQSVDGVKIGGRATLADLHDVFLENLTVNGEVRLKGSSNMVVRGCHVYTPGAGISFQVSGTTVPRNNYIVDNDVVGAAKWVDDQLSVSGYNGGEGIEFTGPGHEVCFNHVRGFRDDISLMEYDEAFEQTSIDICNNDIEEATDDAIEADSAMGNVRAAQPGEELLRRLELATEPGRADLLRGQHDVQRAVHAVQISQRHRRRSGLSQHGGEVRRCLRLLRRRHLEPRGLSQQPVSGRPWRHLRRLRQRQWAGVRPGRRRFVVFVRLRRAGVDWHRHLRGENRVDQVHQPGDAAQPDHRGARGAGRYERLRERVGVSSEWVSGEGDG